MYLAPPYSMSYGYHNDEMDAFIVQIAGEKKWQLCTRVFSRRDQANFQSDRNGDGVIPKGCTEVTMKGGDVLYVPFGTMHHVASATELSSHLTVNVERQFHTWASLLRAAMTKLLHNPTSSAYAEETRQMEAAVVTEANPNHNLNPETHCRLPFSWRTRHPTILG